MDRYETNLNIINHFNSDDINKIYVASGENFPDSLSGAAVQLLPEKIPLL
ncbi:cell wall-binding repeat-containing protein [Clostridium sp. Mt-5]|uniref:Cell wall-binding repeat-containing protein n=1 Tax=Clostridium moutaii TaxID=3240932 RepID=A0ABV4BMF0_9CLOT